MIQGCIVAESLRVGARFAPDIRVTTISRQDMSGSVVDGQPAIWTLIDFTAEDRDADRIAAELARCLAAEGGWYADFRVDDDHVVVFADTVFRYRRGDRAGRADAEAYGRTAGVPDHQLDWPD